MEHLCLIMLACDLMVLVEDSLLKLGLNKEIIVLL